MHSLIMISTQNNILPVLHEQWINSSEYMGMQIDFDMVHMIIQYISGLFFYDRRDKRGRFAIVVKCPFSYGKELREDESCKIT